MRKYSTIALITITIALLLPMVAYAATTSGLPYLSGPEKFKETILELAPIVAVLAFAVAAIAVIFGGDFTGWVKQMFFTCVAVGCVPGATETYNYF